MSPSLGNLEILLSRTKRRKKKPRSTHSKNTVPPKLTRRQIGIARLPPQEGTGIIRAWWWWSMRRGALDPRLNHSRFWPRAAARRFASWPGVQGRRVAGQKTRSPGEDRTLMRRNSLLAEWPRESCFPGNLSPWEIVFPEFFNNWELYGQGAWVDVEIFLGIFCWCFFLFFFLWFQTTKYIFFRELNRSFVVFERIACSFFLIITVQYQFGY